MEYLIPTLYKNYGRYVNQSKMLPNILDGLIPVWRRILLSTHILAKNEYVKSATVFGHCIGHFHPHSEAISGSAEQLVQNEFLDGKGNWGTTIGIEPVGCAAPRYTSLKMNPLIELMAFSFIDDVTWDIDELEPEPRVLPTMVPFCLFTKSEFSLPAFGFKTDIPSYKLNELIRRLLFLLGKGKKIVPKPEIPGCIIESSEDVLEKLLNEKGKHTIQIKGKYTLDPENFRVYVHGWPPKTTFSNVFNRIDSFKSYGLMSLGDVSYIDESTESVGTKIRFEVTRARNRPAIYEKLMQSVTDRLQSTTSYHIYLTDLDGNVIESCVDDMLLAAYNHFVSILVKHFNRRISEIKQLMDEISIIEKIRPHITKVFSINDVNLMIEKLAEISKVEVDKIQSVVNKYKIRKLLSVSTDLTELKTELDMFETKLKDPEKCALDMYNNILKLFEDNKKRIKT